MTSDLQAAPTDVVGLSCAEAAVPLEREGPTHCPPSGACRCGGGSWPSCAGLMATSSGLTPLQRRLVGVGRVLVGVAVVLCTIVLVLGLAWGEPLELMVVTAISRVVAAVPESLPAVVTLALALGAPRMAARHALIRRLPAVETLGSVTVIATGRTGTLAEGRMVARRLTPAGDAEVDGNGYAPWNGSPRRPAGHRTQRARPG